MSLSPDSSFAVPEPTAAVAPKELPRVVRWFGRRVSGG